MIAYLNGVIQLKQETFLILNVAGVGYKVFCPASVLFRVKQGVKLELYTYQQVREDSVQLFGFDSLVEEQMFELLTGVSGIGPKTALGVLNVASVADIKSAVINADASILKKVSGIGAKTAERIVLELKNKISGLIGVDGIKSKEEMSGEADVVEALVSLGFSAGEAREALKLVDSSVNDQGQRVKLALKELRK